MPKPLLVVVLLIAAAGSAALVFLGMSLLSEGEPSGALASASAPVESAAAPTSAALVVRSDIEGAHLFVDAFDRGALAAESRHELGIGPHRVEARRGATVIAALTVEVTASGADVTLHADGTTTEVPQAVVEASPVPRARVARSERDERDDSAPTEPAAEDPTVVAAAAAPETAPTPSASAAPPETAPTPSASAAPSASPAPSSSPSQSPSPAPSPFAEEPSMAPAAMVAPIPVATTSAAMAPAAPVAAAPPSMAPVAAAGPPSESAMRSALNAVLPAVRACAGDFRGDLDVSATFMPDGSVRARIGRLPTREARVCVQTRVQTGVRARPWTGRPSALRHVYSL